MTEEAVESGQQSGETHPGNLKKATVILRKRFSSVRVETLVADGDTALSVHFHGDGANLLERQLLVSNLAQYLPPALSVLGIRPEQKQGSEDASSSNNAS